MIHGNPTQLSHTLYEVCEKSKFVDITTECGRFGTLSSHAYNPSNTVVNPDVSHFRLVLNRLQWIEIDTETYDFHSVERLLTYAVNYIGQKHRKKSVGVHVIETSCQSAEYLDKSVPRCHGISLWI